MSDGSQQQDPDGAPEPAPPSDNPYAPPADGDAAPEPGEPERGKVGAALRSPHLWVSTTYFAEGFPYTVVNNMAEVLFKELGASLQVIGLTSLFHLPWNLKFLWGPFVDNYETKRRWLVATEVAIVAVMVVLAVLAAGKGVALGPLAVGFMILGLLSATHDIAIDGYYLEALDTNGQSRFVGYRAAAYRIAMLVIGGPALALCAVAGWTVGLLVTAIAMALLTAYHVSFLPVAERRKRSWIELARAAASWRSVPLVVAGLALFYLEHRWALGTALQFELRDLLARAPILARIGVGGWIGLALLVVLVGLALAAPILARKIADTPADQRSDYVRSFVSFMEQPKVAVILAFVVLFRTGESFLQKMRWPFLDDVVGLPLEVYGIANGTIGVLASFAATIVGGRLIARDGLRKWIWPFVLAQNVLNLLYMGLASLPDPTVLNGVGSGFGWLPLTIVITLEHVGAGLGTAVFMVYLMRTCDPEHKAGHMAIVTALMSVGFTLAGMFSGFLAEAIGFDVYFGFTFLATIPGMVLIFFIPHLDGREGDS